MKALTFPQIRGRIIEFRLLADNQVRALDEASLHSSVDELLTDLIFQRLLTRWQADQLTEDTPLLRIGKYSLIELLMSGGMGDVYKARHPRTGQTFAIKTISADRQESVDFRKRFDREIEICSRLRHPNIIFVFDADTEEDRDYLVMEHVDGKTFEQLVKDGGVVPVADVCEFGRQAALGLQHAHDMQIVHRDIKPANLMVGWDKSGLPHVKILDFGLAKYPSASPITSSGLALGTLDFMSPEQFLDATKADARSDIYSLGATLYYMIVGQPLRRDQIEYDVSAMAVSDEVKVVISTMLHQSARRRYPNALEVSEVLNNCCSSLEHASIAEVVPPRHTEQGLTVAQAPVNAPIFHYGGVIPPEFFIDRERELAEARQLVENGRGFLLVGSLRSGKTSFCKKLIHQIMEREDNEVLAVYLNVQQWPSLSIETFLEHTILSLLGEISRQVFQVKYASLILANPSEKPTDEAFRTFVDIFQAVRQHTVKSTSEEAKAFRLEEFTRYLKELLEVIEFRGWRRCMVIYDEANRLSKNLSVELLISHHQAFTLDGITSVYSATPWMVRECGELVDTFGHTLSLGPFDDVSAMKALLARYYFGDIRRAGSLPVEQSAIDRLWELSSGKPFLIQLLAGSSFAIANKSGDSWVKTKHVEAGFDKVSVEKPAAFSAEE